MTTPVKAIHRLNAQDLIYRAAAGHTVTVDDAYDAQVEYIAVLLTAGHVVALRRNGTDVTITTVDGVTLFDVPSGEASL